MTPAQTAAATRPEFDSELAAHLAHGFVISTPDAFLMGRPVSSDAPHGLLADPFHRFPAADCDAWMVWLAAGDLRAIWRMVPYRLPWIAWARREGPLKWFSFDSVSNRLARQEFSI